MFKFLFMANLACIMIRTDNDNEDMESNDCARAVTGFISTLC